MFSPSDFEFLTQPLMAWAPEVKCIVHVQAHVVLYSTANMDNQLVQI